MSSNMITGVLGILLIVCVIFATVTFMQTQNLQAQNQTLNDQLAKNQQDLYSIPASSSDIDGFFYSFGENILEKIHKSADACRNKIVSLPSDQKIQWCQKEGEEQLQKLNRKNPIFLDRALERCQDDDCKNRIQQHMDMMKQNQQDQEQRIKENIANCSYLADDMLTQKCDSYESIVENQIRFQQNNHNFVNY